MNNMRNPEFTSKEEYIQYRKDWKNEYMTLSQNIRDYKLIRRYSTQACNKAIQMVGGMLSYDNTSRYFKYVDENRKENIKLQTLLKKYNNVNKLMVESKKATLMLEELKQAKLKANSQYLKSRKVEALTQCLSS